MALFVLSVIFLTASVAPAFASEYSGTISETVEYNGTAEPAIGSETRKFSATFDGSGLGPATASRHFDYRSNEGMCSPGGYTIDAEGTGSVDLFVEADTPEPGQYRLGTGFVSSTGKIHFENACEDRTEPWEEQANIGNAPSDTAIGTSADPNLTTLKGSKVTDLSTSSSQTGKATATWSLTRAPDRDHDGFPDTSDVCPDEFATPDSTDGCPTKPACSDGFDNDHDGTADFPADPSCTSATDTTEGDPPACSDGADNDGDGKVDFPADPGCTAATDTSEDDPPACSDGADNDGDGKVDFPADPGCTSATDMDETDPCTGGYISGIWQGGWVDVKGKRETQGEYGLGVRYCYPDGGGPAQIRATEIFLNKDAGTSSNLKAFLNTLRNVLIDFRHRWKGDKPKRDVRIENLSDGTKRVTASTGRFEVCAGLAVAPARLFGGLWRRIGFRSRLRLAKFVIGRPIGLVAKTYFKFRQTKLARRFELDLRHQPGYTKKRAKREARRRATKIAHAEKGLLLDLVDTLIGSVARLSPLDACTTVWRPKIVVKIPPRGRPPTIDEKGRLSFAWQTRLSR